MWDKLDSFESVLPAEQTGGDKAVPEQSPRRRKPLKEVLQFWALNAVLGSIIAVVYLSVGAAGITEVLPITQQRLHQLPIPAIERLQNYSGWNRVSLALIFAAGLCLAVSLLWIRIFACLQDAGSLTRKRRDQPVLFYLHTFICATVIGVDSALFFIGLSTSTVGWADTPIYVPILATLLFTASLALWGSWHCDFKNSSKV